MALTKKQRDELADSDFAVPGKRALPMHDATHVRLAWDMVDRTHGLTPEEKKTARSRILRKAKELGIDTSDWNKIAALHFEPLAAMSLAVPVTPDHPNKMPFSGVLTKLDEPSDYPPGGSGGRRVLITAQAAEAALDTLLGMAVDFTPGLDGHDERSKIGVITDAHVAGSDLRIAGFFYAADFPVESARIKADHAVMGFSFEAQEAVVEDPDADPLVIVQLVFTGAAVLRKDRAAYTTTSLAASARAAGEIDMTPDELKKLIGEAVSPLATQVTALSATVAELKDKGTITANDSVVGIVKPHADTLNAAADAMERDGVGTHPTRGHASHLRRMAGSMMAEAHMGTMPQIFRDHDYAPGWSAATAAEDPALKTLAAKVDALGTGHQKALDALKAENEKTAKDLAASKDAEIADLKTKLTDAEKAKTAAIAAPERKTLSASVLGVLNRSGFAVPETGALDRDKVMAAMRTANVDPRQRIQVEVALDRAGHFEATA